jgi:hypothetical protein
MHGSDISGQKEREQGSRIEKLRNKLRTLSKEEPIFKASPGVRDDLMETDLEDIIAFESVGSGMSLFEGLQQHGMELPHPDKLNEFLSGRKAMEIFRALEKLRIFLIGFGDMTARELYSMLWHETLWEGCYVKKRLPGAITLIDVSHKLKRSDMQRYLEDLMKGGRVH